MATKKLRAELEVDTSKARQKVAREFAETGGAAAADGGAGGMADAAGNAARSLKELDNGAKAATGGLNSAVKAFAGMGIGLAASFASRLMDPGSTGARVVGGVGTIAGSAIAGASAGSVVPGVGTAAGAVVGAGVGTAKAAVDWVADDKAAEAARVDRLRSIREWERAREQTQAFREQLERLTDVERPAKERMSELTAEIERRKTIDSNLANTQRQAVAKDNAPLLAEATAYRGRNAGFIDALKGALGHLRDQMKKGQSDGLASHASPDALARIGGYFGGGDGAGDMRDIARTGKEQLAVLKSIDAKSGKGATWR